MSTNKCTYPRCESQLGSAWVDVIDDRPSQRTRTGGLPGADDANLFRKLSKASNDVFVKKAFQTFPVHLLNIDVFEIKKKFIWDFLDYYLKTPGFY